MRVTEIQKQIGRGEYQVDTHAVAEAIVRRMMGKTKRNPPGRRSPRRPLRPGGPAAAAVPH